MSEDKRLARLLEESDESLFERFWAAANAVTQPLLETAALHTSPSVERSVLLRMGYSSIEAGSFVTRCIEQGMLGHGAGGILARMAAHWGVPHRDAFNRLMLSDNWTREGTDVEQK